MRKIMMLRAVLSTVAFGLSAFAADAAPAVGEAAPSFTAVDTAGKARSLAEFKGKTVVLEWTNDGCPYVKKHYGAGNMQKLQQDAAKAGHVWLSIISSAPGKQGHVNAAEADTLTRTRGAEPAAVLLDPKGDVGRLYDAQTTPHMFVIDQAGILRYMGAIDDQPTTEAAMIVKARNYVREALAALSSGKKVAEAATDPYGCSVKY
jgi:peroxiredoxin